MHEEILIDFEQYSRSATCRNQGQHKRGEVFIMVMNGLVMTLEEDEIFLCLAVLLCEQLCRFANGGAKTSIKSYFMRSFFCLSVFSSSVRQNYFHSG